MQHEFKVKRITPRIEIFECSFDDEIFESYTGEKVPYSDGSSKKEQEIAEWLDGRMRKWNKVSGGCQDNIETVIESFSEPVDEDEGFVEYEVEFPGDEYE